MVFALASHSFGAMCWTAACVDPEVGGGVTTSQNHIAIGFLSNTGMDPLENHKATKPEFNVGPSLTHQQNAIK